MLGARKQTSMHPFMRPHRGAWIHTCACQGLAGGALTLHRRLHRSGGDRSPPRLQDYAAATVPLDLAPVKNQPRPIHLWGLRLASGGGGRVLELACGADHAAAVTDDGRVWLWGGNARGQLGRGDRRSWCIPKALDMAVFGRGRVVHGISCGSAYTMCLCGGEVWGWGRNDKGQLGHNQVRTPCAPTRPRTEIGDVDDLPVCRTRLANFSAWARGHSFVDATG